MPASELLCQISDVQTAWAFFGSLPIAEQNALVNAASQTILNFCRRDGFGQLYTDEIFDGPGTSRVWLSRRPVISIGSVTLNGVLIDNSDGREYGFNSRTGELFRGSGQDDARFARVWNAGKQNLIVGYWAGSGAIPDPINRAAILATQWLYYQTKINAVYASESIGDYSYTLNQQVFRTPLPDHIAALCAHYVQDDCFA